MKCLACDLLVLGVALLSAIGHSANFTGIILFLCIKYTVYFFQCFPKPPSSPKCNNCTCSCQVIMMVMGLWQFC